MTDDDQSRIHLWAMVTCRSIIGSSGPAKPAIVLNAADHLSYGDLGCYGSRSCQQ